MTTNHNNLSRRETLVGIALGAATAATPIVGASIAKAMQTDRSAWDAAVANYNRANSAFDKAIDAADAAEELWDAECPRVDRYFDTYRLGIGMSAGRVRSDLEMFNYRAANEIDVEAVTKDFMTYQEAHLTAKRRHRAPQLEERVNQLRPAYEEARSTLLATPAPDNAALLFKIEMTATWADDQFAHAVASDARRLLTTGRA